MTVFAETERMDLRALEKSELPRLADLLGEWDIVRWLTVVPFPYTVKHAEEFYGDLQPGYAKGEPQFFVMSLKTDGKLIGGVGLHPPRGTNAAAGESEIGYWLGRDYWGRGLMSEAAGAVIDFAFNQIGTEAVCASTSLDNKASQKVLQKIGLRDCGVCLRDYEALRGSDKIIRWLLTRDGYEKGRA